ncbi:MAG: sulfite exporter TauE/SafE family protein [Planktomarina sp.]
MDVSLLLLVGACLVIIGAFAGFLAGLLGVGGGIVLVPAFFYAFQALGFEGPHLMQVCLATSLATIIVTSIRSTQSHHKKGAVDWDIIRQWTPGIALGAIVGVSVAAMLNSVVLQMIFGGLGGLIGLYLAFGNQNWALADQMPQGIVRWVWAPCLGALSVLLGIDGGSLGVPFMSLHRVPIHRAVATAAAFGLAISVPSACVWLFVSVAPPVPPFTLGAVNIPAFLIIVPMTFLFAPIGANVAHRMNAKPLKRIFGIFLLIVAANMVRTAFWG